jgi:hypothetical protein
VRHHGGIPTRHPRYVPASTSSIAVTVFKVNGSATSFATQVTSLTPGTAPCGTVSGGDYTCTIPIELPVGSDLTQLTLYDGTGATGNVLAQQVTALSVVEGTNNQFGNGSPLTLDENPGAVSVVALSGPTGTQASGFTVTGTANVTFTVGVDDTHGTPPQSQPGLAGFSRAAATGTGANASVSGTTLTLTPPSTGSSTHVVVDANPAGTTDLVTTLASSASAMATSFSVASATGIYVGQNLELDYEAFSGTTSIQEAVHVTGVSGTTISISAPLANAHGAGATVVHSSDNLVPSAAVFTVTINQPPPTVIVPIASNGSGSNVSAFGCCFTTFSQGAGLPNSALVVYGRFDALGNLFTADEQNDVIYKFAYTTASGFAASSTLNGVQTQPFPAGFDVSPGTTGGGTVVFENAGVSTNLDFWPPGGSGSPTGFTSSLPSTSWTTATEQGYPSVAVLSDSTGATFGFAYDLFNVDNSTHDRIVVTSGTSEQDLTSSSIVSTAGNGATNTGVPILTWDQGRQSLIYVNSQSSGGYQILEFKRSGTSGAMLATSPLAVGSVPGYPHWAAASADGNYVAVAGDDGNGGSKVALFNFSGSAWTQITGTALTTADFTAFTAMRFTAGGDLIVADSDGNSTQRLYAFTELGASACATGCTNGYYSLSGLGGFTIGDIATLH